MSHITPLAFILFEKFGFTHLFDEIIIFFIYLFSVINYIKTEK